MRRKDSFHQQSANLPGFLERQPPSSVKTEQCLLGSILLKPDVCDDVISVVSNRDFYDDAHRILFEQMCEMHNSGKKIDVSLLTERLKKEGVLEQVGGIAYLGKLAEAVPHAAHAVDYAQTISDHASRRELIDVGTHMLQQAYDSPRETRELVNEAEQKVFSIIDSRHGTSIKPISEMLQTAMDRLDARMKGELNFSGVSTGFPDLDQMMGGLHSSELIVLAARPGMGKTAFALNLAKHAAIDENAPVLFVSLEMSSTELIDRMLCSIAEINGHHLRNGTIANKQQQRLLEVISRISQAPFFVDDSPARTVLDVAAGARRIKRQNNNRLGLLVIDYLQLLEPDNPRDPRQEQVARMTRRLKGLARELEVPILCLAQLNRQTEASKDNKPRLSHLRESGAIEQDADVVMFVHREEYFQTNAEERQQYEGLAEIVIAKQRNGPTGSAELLWQKSLMRFVSRASHEYDEPEQFGDSGW